MSLCPQKKAIFFFPPLLYNVGERKTGVFPLELYQLRYFKTVAEVEHFTRAAEVLHVTQPSLSKAISNLEAELGVQLFERGKRSIYLSDYGRVFLRRVDHILTELEEAELEIRDMAQNAAGDIHLASCAIFNAPSRLHNYNTDFFLNHPQIGLHMYVTNSAQIEDMLRHRKIDFGFAITPSEHPDITATALFSYRLGLVVSKDHPLAGQGSVWLSELRDNKFLCNNTSPDNRDSVYELCRRAGFEPRVIFEGESAGLIGEAISRNAGVAFISNDRHQWLQTRQEKTPWDDKNMFLNVLDDFCVRTVYLYQLKDRYLTTAARLYRDGLLEFLKEG